MDFDEAKTRMREIQRIMETATLYTLLPGAAAIVGGMLVFVGCGASAWLLRSADFSQIADLPPNERTGAVPDVDRHRGDGRSGQHPIDP